MSRPPLMTALSVTKRYGGVHALRGVTFDVAPGEVHGLLGPNGAGKSTLIKIIAGLVRPDSGEIAWRARDATSDHGESDLGLVMQESQLCPNMTVAENIELGRYPSRLAALRVLDRRAIRTAAREQLSILQSDIAPERPVASLSLGDRRIVEVAKALARRPRLLILDEPTAALGTRETDRLLHATQRVAAQGVSVILVTHRLPELVAVCDRITILRDGATVGTLERAEIAVPRLVEMMSGDDVDDVRRDVVTPGDPHLQVESLSGDRFHDVGFAIRSRESAVITGLVGAGRSSVARALVGLTPSTGSVTVAGTALRRRSMRAAICRGIRFLPEDRSDGLLPDMSVHDNLVLSVLASGRLSRWSLLRRRKASALAHELAARFGIKAADLGQPVRQLSGGNQRKVMLASCFATDPTMLIIDEPTQGVDIAAKADIHRTILKFRSAGGAVLTVTSDTDEALDLGDRFIVMRSGRVVGELAGGEARRVELTRLAFSDV